MNPVPTSLYRISNLANQPFGASKLLFPVPRKQRAVMLVESVLHLVGWFLGPLGFWIDNNPVALRTSPSRKVVVFEPDELSSHGRAFSHRSQPKATGNWRSGISKISYMNHCMAFLL
jgi:hypothetical protein